MGRQSNEEGRRRAAAVAERAMAAVSMNQTQLCAATGLNKGTVSAFMQGERWPNDGSLHKMEKALGLARDTFQQVHDGELGGEPSELSPVSVSVGEHAGGWVRGRVDSTEIAIEYHDPGERREALADLTAALIRYRRETGGSTSATGDGEVRA